MSPLKMAAAMCSFGYARAFLLKSKVAFFRDEQACKLAALIIIIIYF